MQHHAPLICINRGESAEERGGGGGGTTAAAVGSNGRGGRLWLCFGCGFSWCKEEEEKGQNVNEEDTGQDEMKQLSSKGERLLS